jgi:ABC-2 type transport system permease protein
MTFVALATAGLLIPLNCMFSGLGVIVDRQHGALRELLVAPIRRRSILQGNLLAALATTTLQLGVLLVVSAARGASYDLGRHLPWFLVAAGALAVVMYSLAVIMAVRLPSPEEYIGAVPAVAIVPFFFAGSLLQITSLPHWLAAIAKVLPLTHALALIRYGLTPAAGYDALHNIWGLQSGVLMASLSLVVLVVYATLALKVAVRLFSRSAAS